MLVPVESLHDVVEAVLGLPPPFILFLFLHLDLIFVDDWECEAQVLR